MVPWVHWLLNGPHLHFSFTINDVWINPITILEHGVPLIGVED